MPQVKKKKKEKKSFYEYFPYFGRGEATQNSGSELILVRVVHFASIIILLFLNATLVRGYKMEQLTEILNSVTCQVEYKNSGCVYVWWTLTRYDEAYCQMKVSLLFCFILYCWCPSIRYSGEKKTNVEIFLLMLMLTDQAPYFLLTSYLLEANLKHVGF